MGSFVRCNDMWFARDNRFLNPVSTYGRKVVVGLPFVRPDRVDQGLGVHSGSVRHDGAGREGDGTVLVPGGNPAVAFTGPTLGGIIGVVASARPVPVMRVPIGALADVPM